MRYSGILAPKPAQSREKRYICRCRKDSQWPYTRAIEAALHESPSRKDHFAGYSPGLNYQQRHAHRVPHLLFTRPFSIAVSRINWVAHGRTMARIPLEPFRGIGIMRSWSYLTSSAVVSYNLIFGRTRSVSAATRRFISQIARLFRKSRSVVDQTEVSTW